MKKLTRKFIKITIVICTCIGGKIMADKEFLKGEVFTFDMGAPGETTTTVHYKKCEFNFTEDQVREILKTIPAETLAEYGINEEGDDTPAEATEEGKLYASRLNAEDTGLLTRMTREGYTCTDKADYYDWSHGKWSSRGGKKPAFIIPHHMAGNLTPEQFYAIMHSSRQMSPTVSVHTDGTVYAWVPEEMRP